MTRVLIAAPTPMLRAGLRAMLASAAVQVVGDVATLAGRAVDPADVDVIVVADAELLADVPRRLAEDGRPAVLALGGDGRTLAALRALPLYGWGIVAPEATAEELQAAVAAVALGLIVLPPPLLDRLAGQRPGMAEPLAEPLAESLTAREREVLELLSAGLSNKLIARTLQISEHTVKFHVSSIYAKLGASSRTDAVSRGARYGLITL